MTLKEYNLLMRGYNIRQVDKNMELHLQAWLNVQAGATKKRGKKQEPVYKTFKSFYDYETELAKAKGEHESEFLELSKHLKEKHNG